MRQRPCWRELDCFFPAICRARRSRKDPYSACSSPCHRRPSLLRNGSSWLYHPQSRIPRHHCLLRWNVNQRLQFLFLRHVGTISDCTRNKKDSLLLFGSNRPKNDQASNHRARQWSSLPPWLLYRKVQAKMRSAKWTKVSWEGWVARCLSTQGLVFHQSARNYPVHYKRYRIPISFKIFHKFSVVHEVKIGRDDMTEMFWEFRHEPNHEDKFEIYCGDYDNYFLFIYRKPHGEDSMDYLNDWDKKMLHFKLSTRKISEINVNDQDFFSNDTQFEFYNGKLFVVRESEMSTFFDDRQGNCYEVLAYTPVNWK